MPQLTRLPAEKATDRTGSRGRGKKLRVEVQYRLPFGHSTIERGDRTAMQGVEGTAALVSPSDPEAKRSQMLPERRHRRAMPATAAREAARFSSSARRNRNTRPVPR